MTIDDFNSLDAEAASAFLRPALDIARWIDEIVAARPFATREQLLRTAATAAEPFTVAEIDQALVHHPRIGDRAEGDGAEAELSRAEQGGIDPDDADLQRELRARNVAYEERFGRVFLIRAAGRTPAEILATLEERMGNDAERELRVIAQQLRQIATGRLEGMTTP
ncbi:2-oxo-4-hydroxy-4-carboxy--5-ureidoimidazoline (OHCU) decarboxylase [Brachybacterium faecium]|uniref:2-oxo-4-hydroxy-4-carboxy-5-ureidoimidazoline decarboxylase n=1 Tax=Brachybacterium faecium (strain ATCC 43885 / DSM 4810 / JCM 11609 / LMG 19847 / NBRC 14762 / NCIMB 9860 / 6-10) TaxID=446465 RepID=C7M9Y7_BRAFD|nr:2-oxo-4-hydroxy-4-carboxy-5-ureidoimidazoline decarboxylase [Brachybacterium faecium]ACU84681.1 OHCU decarboxylase [Brachybacterium faecium DSM 4810]SLM99349.1 2-oxo-4-hydroxy-4-carboxy--5-ureidoimidazoline (OHCU) decarboxylase [Brachybacterium faecium]